MLSRIIKNSNDFEKSSIGDTIEIGGNLGRLYVAFDVELDVPILEEMSIKRILLLRGDYEKIIFDTYIITPTNVLLEYTKEFLKGSKEYRESITMLPEQIKRLEEVSRKIR